MSNKLNEVADISPETALHISIVFGGTPKIWLCLQMKYDLQKAAEKVGDLRLTRYMNERSAQSRK